ncbi:HNH endonuclease [Aquincola tertiaricarbonis]|uniref:Putative HNH nuclease YajD n=1 Tax=Aquincola tertiaricarbonis TaxID=391953 RepID=A0ABY4SJB2_AQUTE|nr:HNH endonuclease signature motif containing protein [Aquincola tertiaricarbonis]URI11435.1 HNH endonuclease [Aquincola tertiaricarbonis]
MPMAAPKPCAHPGCGQLVRDGTSRCSAHKVRPGSFADAGRGTRQERGYGAAWDRLRRRILVRDGGLCQPCLQAGHTTAAQAVDHIVNKATWRRRHGSLKGCDDEGNLQSICNDCHRQKTDREKRGEA